MTATAKPPRKRLDLSKVKRKGEMRMIDLGDVESMAELVNMRMTETEAALQLGIDPQRWFTFKARADVTSQFSNALSRVRAAKIKSILNSIEDAGHGRGVYARADWRALESYARMTMPQTFGERAAQSPESSTDALADSLLAKMLSRAYASPAPVVDCPRKELPESATEAEVVEPAPCGDGI
jgi:hypothetical protein